MKKEIQNHLHSKRKIMEINTKWFDLDDHANSFGCSML